MVYSMAYWAWHGGDGRIYGMIWQAWHGIWYGLAGMVFFMVCLVVWHGIWYGLGEHGVVYGITWVDMAWYMVWPGRNDIVYGMSGGMAWYLVWPGRVWRGIWYYLGRHGMVCGMAWRE